MGFKGRPILNFFRRLIHTRKIRLGKFEYWRLGNQQIGEALLTLPDGSELLLEGQKSELPHVTITATSIEIDGKQVNP